MNRLQKKCLFAAIGLHLLLALILLVGPAFLSSPSKLDDSETIDLIPANLIDGQSFGGGPKAPASALAPQPPQARAEVEPQRPPPRPVEQPRAQSVVQREQLKPTPRNVESVDSKPDKSKPKISLTPVTRPRNAAETSSDSHVQDQAKRRADVVRQTVNRLSDGLSSSTEIKTSGGFGGSGEANANYAQVVKSIYQKSWIEPTDTASDDATAKVSVTIASDGRVLSARITQMSGDEQTDASIQRTLDRVKFIAPFPAGTTDKERTYIINFNLKAKRLSA